jgi:hypothetical protein
MVMNRSVSLALAAFLVVLSACAPVNRINPLSMAVARSLLISDVVVNTDAAAFENELARDYSSQLAGDLDVDLTNAFSDRIHPSGMIMRVEISRLNVANSGTNAFGRDQSALQGTVQIVNPADSSVMANYSIDVRVGQASETRLGAVLSTAVQSSQNFYRRLVAQFVRDTKTRVLE